MIFPAIAVSFGALMTYGLLALILLIIPSILIYKKAGKTPIAAIVPIWNIFVFCKIINKSYWWVLLFCIPFVNVIFVIWATNLLAKKFGKSTSFTVGIILLPIVFIPILGYGKALYQK